MKNLRFTPSFYVQLGIAAAILVGIGEYLLHFSPTGPAGEIDMLLNIPLERDRIGHFFAIVGIPLYFAGYYGLLKLFRESHELFAKCLFISGMASFTVGGIWISSRYFAAVVLQKSQGTELYQTFLDAYAENYQVLVWGLRVVILLVSIFYVLSILKNKSGLPRRLVVLNPIVLLATIFSTLIWLKSVGIHIVPIAMNVTHAIFFAVILFFLKSNKRPA